MEDGEIEEGMVVEESALAEQPPREATAKSPFDMLKESKAAMQEIVASILLIKKGEKPKSELRELVTQMLLHFVTLRQANRSILLEEDRVKAETERAKAPVDFTTLQLHNLMYEKSHYLKAIKACKDFKSKYPDIELVAEEEFFRDAPEEIKAPNLSDDSSHNLMLKRLNFELFQRKELCKLLEKLEQQKKGLFETIANRKKFLSSLPSHLKSLKKASLPVQNQLGVLHTKKMKQHHSAELLPPPLYVIYSQFVAQKEAFGEDIDLEIGGSVKDAQTFARQQANKDAGLAANGESSRTEEDAPDEEDDGQRRRKRPRKVPSKESLEQGGIYQVHPLKIILHIYDDEVSESRSEKLISLKFEYMLKLNVVCVGVEGSTEGPENNILCNLFPDDSGLDLPHQSAKLFVGDALSFDEKRYSRPYKWAQHLAGIDFLPEVSPMLSSLETSNTENKNDAFISGLAMYRQQNRVQTVVQRIRSRKKAQLAVVEQLDSLLKLKWPSLDCKTVPWALHAPACKLHSWSSVGTKGPQAITQSASDTLIVPEPMEVDLDGRSGTSKEEMEGTREDGELPSLNQPASKGSTLNQAKQLALISKSIRSPLSLLKTSSFRKHDNDADLILETDSDVDEPALVGGELEDDVHPQCYEIADKSWVDYGVREFCLLLVRKMGSDGSNMTLEAKVKISMEYPLRPPVFVINLFSTPEENSSEKDSLEWHNEVRAMEAEINLHMLKMVPTDQENYLLTHQILCLAMLFDYLVDEASSSSKTSSSCSVMDVGLCKPVGGKLLDRSLRGRDRRKVISWQDMDSNAVSLLK